MLSKNRQNWIDTLRNEISEYIVCVIHTDTVSKIDQSDNKVNNVLENMKDVLLHLSKVRLLINQKEDDHESLINKMDEMYNGLKIPEYDFSKAEKELIKLSQTVLKREWERVKSFT